MKKYQAIWYKGAHDDNNWGILFIKHHKNFFIMSSIYFLSSYTRRIFWKSIKSYPALNDELFLPVCNLYNMLCPTANLIVGVELAKSDYTIKTCQSTIWYKGPHPSKCIQYYFSSRTNLIVDPAICHLTFKVS